MTAGRRRRILYTGTLTPAGTCLARLESLDRVVTMFLLWIMILTLLFAPVSAGQFTIGSLWGRASLL